MYHTKNITTWARFVSSLLSHSMGTQNCRKRHSLPKSVYLERFLTWLLAAPPLGNGVSSCDTNFYNKIWCSYTFALNELFEYQKNLY